MSAGSHICTTEVSNTLFRPNLSSCYVHVQVKMANNNYDDIYYTYVPGVSIKRNKKASEEHDKLDFSEYLKSVRAGHSKISASGLKPHELVCEVMTHIG